MTKIKVCHQFFSVGQGLFATGVLEVGPSQSKSRRRIKNIGQSDAPSDLPYRWVYDCGTSSPKRLVKNAIAELKKDCGGQKIDLLTLSHFHNDHINGVVELLKEIGAKTVMLPWVPLWHRLLIGFDQGFGAVDPEMLFFVDPVQYFWQVAGDDIEQVLFVMPSEGEGPPFPTEPIEDPEPPEYPDGEKGSGELDLMDELELSPNRSVYTRTRKLEPGKAITVRRVWEFIPYNDPSTRPVDPFGFRAKVDALKHLLLQGSNEEREGALSDLKALYANTFGRSVMNNVSLFLYGGAIGQWRGRRYCACHFRLVSPYCDCWDEHESRAAILFTGDGNLGSSEKWDALSKYLDQHRATQTSVFQVPHHGAGGNSYCGLATAAAPQSSIFSSDPLHNYRHPHADVLRDFWPYHPIQVDQHSKFMIQIVLER